MESPYSIGYPPSYDPEIVQEWLLKKFGNFMAIPVITGFATEIALKNLQYIEKGEVYEIHELDTLYDSLSQDLRERINGKHLQQNSSMDELFGSSTTIKAYDGYTRVRDTLKTYRKVFTDLRYDWPQGEVDTPPLAEPLITIAKAILAVCSDVGISFAVSMEAERTVDPDPGVTKTAHKITVTGRWPVKNTKRGTR